MRFLLPFMVLLAVVPAGAALAQVAADDSTAAAIRRDGLRIETPRAVVWVGPGALTEAEAAAFAERLESGLAAIESLIGHGLDSARYGGTRVEAFVGAGVGISHVYGSYDHMKHARPWLFLDAEKVRSGEAPYLHEATHLLAWKFGSHSLREGFASWVEAEIRSRTAGGGAAIFGATSPAEVDADARARLELSAASEVVPWIGRTGFAPASVTTPRRPKIRATYYVLSQSFAQHLIREIGIADFLRVYASDDPERELERLSGTSLSTWKDRWRAALAALATSSLRGRGAV